MSRRCCSQDFLVGTAFNRNTNDKLIKTKYGWPEEIIPKGTYKKGYPYAFGLIQFKATAAKDIGTTLRAIYHANINQQFEFVKKYLDKKGVMRHKNIEQYTLYTLIFAPGKAGVGPNDTVYAKGTEDYDKNSSIDRDNKNGITKKEIAYRVDNYIRLGKKYAITLL